MEKNVMMNLKVKGYTSWVLGVVKEKYGLKDKSQAMDKFAKMYGGEFVEREAKDSYIKKLIEIEEAHFKKYGYKKMSDDELDRLFGK